MCKIGRISSRKWLSSLRMFEVLLFPLCAVYQNLESGPYYSGDNNNGNIFSVG